MDPVTSKRTASRFGWLGRAAFGAAVLAACVLAFWLGAGVPHAAARPNAGLVIRPESLDFGTVWASEHFEWPLLIENPTHEDVRILDWTARGCCGSSIEPAALTIPAGENAEVVLALNLMTDVPALGQPAERAMQLPLVPRLEGRLAREQGWTLRGTVHFPYTLSPQAVQFAETLVEGTAMEPREVVIECHRPVQAWWYGAVPAAFRVRAEADAETPGRWLLRVTPQESLRAGRFEFVIALRGITPDDEALGTVTIPVGGTVLADIQAIPRELYFTGYSIGDSAEATVVLRSARGARFSIEGVSCEDDQLLIEAVTSGSAERHVFRVLRGFVHPGPAACNLEFSLRTEQDEPKILIVPVSSYAVEAGRDQDVVSNGR